MPPMAGQISFFPYTFAPAGWMFCDGQLLSISENETLFFLMGTRFGGDGESTFALPDLRTAAPAHTHYCISLFGTFRQPYYDGIVGETFLSFDPPGAENLLECTGQSIAKNKYALLETYMGARFGGDGGQYNLPDLRSKAPKGFRYVMTVNGEEPQWPRARTPFVGELLLLPYEVNSDAWLLCNGSRVKLEQHRALYSLLGNNFGGDEKSFGLPDLRSAAPDKFNYYLSSGGVFPTRP